MPTNNVCLRPAQSGNDIDGSDQRFYIVAVRAPWRRLLLASLA